MIDDKYIKILKSYGIEISADEILKCYSEPHRYWHTIDHLLDIIREINKLYKNKRINKREYNILIISAIFHDIVYDPKRKDNEDKSVGFMLSKCNGTPIIDENIVSSDISRVSSIILNTKYHISKDNLSKKFNKIDTNILNLDFKTMLEWENGIYLEYKWAGKEKYKEERLKFLLKSIKEHKSNEHNIRELIKFVFKNY